MGAVKWPDRRAPPPKEANLELMKIPNFLHLTPAHIRQHCRAIKSRCIINCILYSISLEFCTKWPEELRTSDDERVHFPLNISYSTYVHQGPSIRDMRTRIVTVQMPLSAMNLDTHAREKFIRLIGNRYDKETDTMTIVADRYCKFK
jgi:small subunit ribosomal protein S35